MSLRVLIVDDEPLSRAVVREHLQAHPEVEVAGECGNGFEAVKACAELKPDLVFLDIQMPKLDGFEVLELLDPRPGVVFVTAFDQHALRAFEVHAVDYLLKPFSRERFEEALRRARGRLAEPGPAPVPPEALAREARQGAALERVVVKDGTKVTVVPVARLDFVQAQDDYVMLWSEGKGVLKQQTLASLEQQLDPARFIRIHRSYLMQLDRLKRLEQEPSERWMAVLQDGTRLPVSRTGYARLQQALGGA